MIAMHANADPFGLIGCTLGEKYRVNRVIGEGGFGVVYAGTHALLDESIAIKCMRPAGHTPRSSANESEIFLREAKVLFTLSHPGIVRLYDIGTFNSSNYHAPYVVLELLDGGTLEQRIAERFADRQHFNARELLAMFEPVLSALDYAHCKGVVHRDLKPSNIMFASSDDASLATKVVDFGIARWTNAKMRAITTRGAPMFSPVYAAPEQWDPTLGPTDAVSDIFSLGLVLAEACMLQPVLDPTSGLVQLMQQAMDVPARLAVRAARPDLGPAFAGLIEHATRCARVDRLHTVREFLDRLRAAVAEAPDMPAPPPAIAKLASGNRWATSSSIETASVPLGESGPVPPSALPQRPSRIVTPPSPIFIASTAPKLEERRSSRAPAAKLTLASAAHSSIPLPDVERPSVDRGPLVPRLIAGDDEYCMATLGPAFVVVWKRDTPVGAAKAIQFALRDFAAGSPEGRVALFTVVEEQVPAVPSPDARTALANILRFNADEIICSAVTMRGSGFRAATVRGVATGLSLLARQPFPHRVFATVDQSAAWVVQNLVRSGISVDLAQMIRGVEELAGGPTSR